MKLGRSREYYLKIDYKYIAITSAIGILNSILCYNKNGAIVMVAIEMAWLICLFIRGDAFRYICYYIIFITMSMEFSTYYGTESIYGFRETRIAGIGVSTLAIIPMVILGLTRIDLSVIRIRSSDKKITKFIRFIFWLFFVGLVIGIFNILIDDNNVNTINSIWRVFLGEVYNYIVLLIFPVVSFSYAIKKYAVKINEIKSVLFAIIIGIVFTQVFSFISPFKGTTWESTTLLVSFVSFYIPALVCFSFYFSHSRRSMALMVVGLIGLLLSTVYAVTSGGLLAAFLVPIMILIILKERGKTVSLVFGAMIFCVLLMVAVGFMSSILNNASILLEYKLSQALSLIEFWKPDWYSLLPRSAKFRFQEAFNILSELFHKPYTLLFGKGIMGTCIDYSGSFYASNYMYEQSAFTNAEWTAGVFFSMHESFNVLLLSSGLFGVSFFIWTVKTCLKNLSKSPFLIIGMIYMMFHYTYSFTASNFGIICLLVGLYEIDNHEVKQKCQLRFQSQI